ncbi:hypothetical protein [Streptomyces aidingensis]|uniref:Uncharacterized protein n=1 Tax=Streptomyces aidingensis TaxID=910347 RepID=A0A1I1JIC8_9ACTN|nr:hypothetical protein [Streptomyces aidingensis]SFC47722.1 hypothetical protein SAMN05421773_103414 [Streptomyces aidingensis]
MSEGGGHRFEERYAERDLGEVAGDFRQRSGPDGRSVVLEGTCPGCLGRSVTRIPRGAPGAGTKGLLGRFGRRREAREAEAEPDLLETEVLFCECGYAHPEQPAEVAFRGCGAQWRVRPDDDGGTP